MKYIFPFIFIISCSIEPEDCNSDIGGNAYIDQCGQCVGGLTNAEACIDVDQDGYNDVDIAFLQDMKNTFEVLADSELFNIGTQYWRGGRLLRFSCNSCLLAGQIPESIFSLISLESLELESNNLTGSISESIGSLINLRNLQLYNNALTGTIPTSLGNLINIGKVYDSLIVNDTKIWDLYGEINLRKNQLTGTIPPEIGNLENLTKLDLRSNQLTGEIPPEIGNLTSLRYLYLSNNQLTGDIPQEVCDLIESNTLEIHRILNGNNLTNTCE